MFAKHSPPATRRRNAANGGSSKTNERKESARGRNGESESRSIQVRNSAQVQSKADTGPNIAHGSDSDTDTGLLVGSAAAQVFDDNRGGNPEVSKVSEEADSQKINAKANETKGEISTVGKLSDTMYRPFGTRSRSGSLSGSDTAICKGGPNGSCGIEVMDSDKAMQCDRCDRWFHCSCQGVPLPTYEIATHHKELLWLCKECKDIIRTIPSAGKSTCDEIEALRMSLQTFMQTNTEQFHMTQGALKDKISEDLRQLGEEQAEQKKTNDEKFKELQKAVEGQKASLDASKTEQLNHVKEIKEQHKQILKLVQDQGKLLESSLKDRETMQKTYASVVKGQCEEVMNTISTQIEKLPLTEQSSKSSGTRSSTMQFTGIFDAFVDRERRKNNIVVHNMTESDGETHAERMTRDRSRLGELLRKELNLNVHILRSFRVGKFTEGKSRLLIATLDSEETKWEVVRVAPQLRGTDTGHNIYINPDMTKQEREEGKKLRNELAERRAKGERNLIIRRGKIVRHQQRTDGPGEQQQVVERQRAEPALAPQVGDVNGRGECAGGETPPSDQGQADSDQAQPTGSMSSDEAITTVPHSDHRGHDMPDRQQPNN